MSRKRNPVDRALERERRIFDAIDEAVRLIATHQDMQDVQGTVKGLALTRALLSIDRRGI